MLGVLRSYKGDIDLFSILILNEFHIGRYYFIFTVMATLK